jgi:hypothetical protein
MRSRVFARILVRGGSKKCPIRRPSSHTNVPQSVFDHLIGPVDVSVHPDHRKSPMPSPSSIRLTWGDPTSTSPA